MECWEPSQHLLIDRGKPRKTCVEVTGRRTFRKLTSCQQSGMNRICQPPTFMHLLLTFSCYCLSISYGFLSRYPTLAHPPKNIFRMSSWLNVHHHSSNRTKILPTNIHPDVQLSKKTLKMSTVRVSVTPTVLPNSAQCHRSERGKLCLLGSYKNVDLHVHHR